MSWLISLLLYNECYFDSSTLECINGGVQVGRAIVAGYKSDEPSSLLIVIFSTWWTDRYIIINHNHDIIEQNEDLFLEVEILDLFLVEIQIYS